LTGSRRSRRNVNPGLSLINDWLLTTETNVKMRTSRTRRMTQWQSCGRRIDAFRYGWNESHGMTLA
jgi:hypothetical protein